MITAACGRRAESERQSLLHQVAPGGAGRFLLVGVLEFVDRLRIEPAELQGDGRLRAPRPAERLDQSVVRLRPMELPGDPGVFREAVRHQRVEIAVVVRRHAANLRGEFPQQFVIQVLAAEVVAQHDAQRVAAADAVGVDRVDRHRVRAEIGNPLEQAVVERLLGGQVAVVVVGRMQRHGAAHGLQVVAPAARGATVDDQLRVPLPQGVPIGQIALDVQVLGHALAVGRVVAPPEVERVHVEILAVEVDALLASACGPRGRSATSAPPGCPGPAACLPSSHSGWFCASHVPPATRSGSNQTSVLMPFARA